MSAKIEVYTMQNCPYCVRAKALLHKKGVDFEEFDITKDDDKRKWLIQASGGRKTLPQIFIHGEPIGGYDDLYALQANGQLDEKIKQES